jgi:hypothetical protein
MAKKIITALCISITTIVYGQNPVISGFSAAEIAGHISAGAELAGKIRAAANDLSQKEYIVPPGHYGFNMTEMIYGALSGFVLSDIRRPDDNPFTLMATGVTFWFVPTDRPAPEFSRALHIANCSNISLVGATLDTYSSLYAEGHLTAIDKTGNRIEIQLFPGSISDEDMIRNVANRAESRIIPQKANGRAMPALYNINDTWGPEYLWISKVEKNTENSYWLTFRSDRLLNTISKDSWKTAYGNEGVLEIGDGIALVYGSVLGIALDNSKQITMQDIRCYIPRGGFWENGGYGNHLWKNCRFEPRPNSGRLMGGEGNMAQGLRVGSTYDELYIGITSDDAINIHGFWSKIKSADGRILSVDYAPVGIQAGDPVEFYSPGGQLVYAGTVAETPESQYNYNGFLNSPLKMLEAPPDDAVSCFLRWPHSECSGWKICNSTFEHIYQRILIQSGSGVFENNRIYGMGSNLSLNASTEGDYEGGFLHDIIVRNNVFIRSAICPNYSPVLLSFNTDWAPEVSAVNIVLQDNLFVGAGAAVLRAENVKGLIFSGNIAINPFITATYDPSLLKSNTICHVTCSSDIRINDNMLIEQVPHATGNKFINMETGVSLSNNHSRTDLSNSVQDKALRLYDNLSSARQIINTMKE